MSPTETQLDKIFIRNDFAVHYRRARRAAWSIESRPDYFVLFMLSGQMSYQVGDQEGILNKQGALLIDPGKVANASGTNTSFLTLALSSSYVLDCAVRAGLLKSGAIVSFRNSIIEQSARQARLVRSISEELIENEAGQEIVLTALVEQLVVQLLRTNTNVRRSDQLELSRAGLVDRRVRRAVELMHANLDRDLPLEEIAAVAYLSPFHFSRLFKKLTGATPHAFLAGLRAARAQALLAETDYSITEISARVGYASPSHFTKAFRQATGLTPRAFRAAVVRP